MSTHLAIHRVLGRSSLGLVVSCVLLVAASAEAVPVAAKLILVEGVTKTYKSRTRDGYMVDTGIPIRSLADVKPDPGTSHTVTGTVLSIHPAAHQVRVRTRAGQVLVLGIETTRVSIGEVLTLLLSR